MYFTLAIYLDFETAKSELMKRASHKDCALTDQAIESYSDSETIEIRERKIGWSDRYKIVFKLVRTIDYNEANDEYEWTNHDTKN